jgi:hypothetical protein
LIVLDVLFPPNVVSASQQDFWFTELMLFVYVLKLPSWILFSMFYSFHNRGPPLPWLGLFPGIFLKFLWMGFCTWFVSQPVCYWYIDSYLLLIVRIL